jgi:hypothetical protein
MKAPNPESLLPLIRKGLATLQEKIKTNLLRHKLPNERRKEEAPPNPQIVWSHNSLDVQFLKAFKHSTRFPHRKAFVPGLSRWAAKTSEEDAQ